MLVLLVPLVAAVAFVLRLLRLTMLSLATMLALASASPRNPNVRMLLRSSSRTSLLVAKRVAASARSGGLIPPPSSATVRRRIPPAWHWTSMVVEPASRLFSISSLAIEAGRCTTSPAAILSTTSLGRGWIRAGAGTGTAVGAAAPGAAGWAWPPGGVDVAISRSYAYLDEISPLLCGMVWSAAPPPFVHVILAVCASREPAGHLEPARQPCRMPRLIFPSSKDERNHGRCCSCDRDCRRRWQCR